MAKHLPGCPCSRCPRVRLTCGCVRFVDECEEARRLWIAVVKAHHRCARAHRACSPLTHDCGHFQPYYEALDVYQAHFAAQVEESPAEQAALIQA